jgi:hypothetical protein
MAEHCYAECHIEAIYAECLYAECHGALFYYLNGGGLTDSHSIIVLLLLLFSYKHRYRKKKIDCLRFVMCPLLALPNPRLFYCSHLRQTRQAVHAIKQSIALDVYAYK